MAGTDGNVSPGKFDGTDFAFWKLNIEDYLYGKELDGPLAEKPEDEDEAKWKKLDRRVLGIIRPCLSRNVAANVAKETTTKGLMNELSDLYETPSTHNKIYLMKKLFNLKMLDNTPVTTHLNEFNAVVNQLSIVDVSINDEMQALILLASLPNSWEPMRAVVSNSTGTKKLEFKDIRERILNEEIRKIDSGENKASTSPLSIERGRNQNRENWNKGRSKSRGWSKPRNSGRTLECI